MATEPTAGRGWPPAGNTRPPITPTRSALSVPSAPREAPGWGRVEHPPALPFPPVAERELRPAAHGLGDLTTLHHHALELCLRAELPGVAVDWGGVVLAVAVFRLVALQGLESLPYVPCDHRDHLLDLSDVACENLIELTRRHGLMGTRASFLWAQGRAQNALPNQGRPTAWLALAYFLRDDHNLREARTAARHAARGAATLLITFGAPTVTAGASGSDCRDEARCAPLGDVLRRALVLLAALDGELAERTRDGRTRRGRALTAAQARGAGRGGTRRTLGGPLRRLFEAAAEIGRPTEQGRRARLAVSQAALKQV